MLYTSKFYTLAFRATELKKKKFLNESYIIKKKKKKMLMSILI